MITLTNTHTTSFFDESDNMVIGHNVVVNIQEDFIKDVDDLDMVDKDFIKQLTDNLKWPGDQINVCCAMLETPAFNFGAKLQMILETTLIIV